MKYWITPYVATAWRCHLNLLWCLLACRAEHGPLTLGYERWANLAPEIVELQSFGHASVSEDGELTIKLMNIDGNVLYEKTMTPVTSDGIFSEDSSSMTSSTSSVAVATTSDSSGSSSSEGSSTTGSTSFISIDSSTTTSTVPEESINNSTTADSADKGTLPSSGSYSMMVLPSWCAIIVLFVVNG